MKPLPTAALCIVLLAGTARAGGPLADAVSAAVRQRDGWFLVNGRWARPTATLGWEDLVRVDVDPDGTLTFAAARSPAADRVLQFGRQALVLLRRDRADPGRPYVLSAAGRQWTPGREGLTDALQARAVPQPGVAARAGGVRIESLQFGPDGATVEAIVEARRVALRCGPAQVGATVFDPASADAPADGPAQGPAQADPPTTFAAADFLELRRDHPVAARRFVAPVLARLNGGVDPLAPRAGDVYRAFASIPADPAAAEAVGALVAKLAAPDPATRRRASDALSALGRPGVLAAARVDPARCPPDARLRLNALIAANSFHYRTPPAALRADPHFLIDCLSDPDPRVRAAAAGALSTLTGTPIDPATADAIALHARFAPE